MQIVRIEPGAREICDFCSDPHPVRAYASDNFLFQKDSPLPQMSDGAWAACQKCGELVDAGQWADLSARSFESLCRSMSVRFIDQPKLRLTIMDLHRLFREHMHLDA